MGREPPSEPPSSVMISSTSVAWQTSRLSRRGCVVGSPKLCSMESSFTLLWVVRAVEKLGSHCGLVGLQPPKRLRCAHGVDSGLLAQAVAVAGRPCVRLYRHNAMAKATMVSPATMIAQGSAPSRSNHCV